MKYKCYAYINEVTWMYGNHGYVAIPKEHPFFGKNTTNILMMLNIL